MMRKLPWILTLVVLSSSCAKLGLADKDGDEKKPESPFGPTGVPPHLRGRGPGNEGSPVAAGGNTPLKPGMPAITPEEDILFTDPDNPDAGVPELSSVLASQKRGPWEESETIARQRSMREGKPLLIWFTDSARSPMCKAISQELFSKHEFGDWADDHIVRLKIDSNSREPDSTLSLDDQTTRELAIKHYVNNLKKRYKVLGNPYLVMLNPSGEVVDRHRGYKRGDADYVFGRIKHWEVVASKADESWRKNLEKKGYREWSDRRGRTIFAKLISYSKGTLVLVEPDGSRARTKESKLSNEDRAWIAGQKKARGMQ